MQSTYRWYYPEVNKAILSNTIQWKYLFKFSIRKNIYCKIPCHFLKSISFLPQLIPTKQNLLIPENLSNFQQFPSFWQRVLFFSVIFQSFSQRFWLCFPFHGIMVLVVNFVRDRKAYDSMICTLQYIKKALQIDFPSLHLYVFSFRLWFHARTGDDSISLKD